MIQYRREFGIIKILFYETKLKGYFYLKKYMIFDEIKAMFNKFAFISVRDNNSKNVLNEMGFEVC